MWFKVFISRDPFPGWVGLPASQHPYSYVHNNPVNLTDPSGKFVLVAAVAACLAHPVCLTLAITGSAIVIGYVLHLALHPPDVQVPPAPDIDVTGELEVTRFQPHSLSHNGLAASQVSLYSSRM